MSNFTNDPNPFGDPFADPSITQVTNKPTTGQSGLEDYNPFANQPTRPNAQVRGASNPPQLQGDLRSPAGSQPAVLQTSNTSNDGRVNGQQAAQPPPPAYTQTAAQNITQAELQKRQEELEKKAAELAAREEALRTAQGNVREPNWPPVPKVCPFGPCLYQDINVDIPPEFQKIVRLSYYLWMYYVGVLFANFLGAIALWAVEGNGGHFGFSLIALIIFTPVSFLCWFRPLYKAFRSDSSFNFMVFFFVFFCQLVMSIIWAIGIPSMGSIGLITAIESIGQGIFYALFMFLVAFIVISYAFLSFLVLVKVHSIYRSTGASFAKAQAEFAHGVLKNEQVQQAATAAAAGAARQAMGQAFAGGGAGGAGANTGSGLRY